MLRTAMGIRGSGTKDFCVLCTQKRGDDSPGTHRDDLGEHQHTLNRGFLLDSDGNWIGKFLHLFYFFFLKKKKKKKKKKN
jgi:hypothetical protein